MKRRQPTAKDRCTKCGGSGKVDRGNGSTRPCDCTAGLIEQHRRKSLRAERAAAKDRGISGKWEDCPQCGNRSARHIATGICFGACKAKGATA